MKKIVASVGLVALGASSINAIHAQDISTAPTKSWNISASLRGFYDDNVNTASDSLAKTDSLGIELRPGVSLNWGNDQTTVKMGYAFGLKYYQHGPWDTGNSVTNFDTINYDMNHTFDLSISHAFNERYRMSVGDAFVLGQEPDLLRGASGASASPQRVPGNNMRNFATLAFDAQVTPAFKVEVRYENEWVNYENSGVIANTNTPPFTIYTASLSGLLDRMGNSGSLDGMWQITPETVGVIGYKFSMDNYTGDEIINGYAVGTNTAVQMSDDRDSSSHYIYAGVDHVFLPELTGSARVGARMTDYSLESAENKTSPYVQASLRYVYTVDSYAELGCNYDRSATDRLSPIGSDIALDKDSLLVFGSIRHKLASKLFGGVVAQIQRSTYNGGEYDTEEELYYMIGLNLKYRFNSNWAAEVGYNYDKLDTDITSFQYDRNRIYVGVSASY